MRNNSGHVRIVARRTLPAKGKIVDAGVPLREVARVAGIAPSTLSDYLGGRLRNNDRRFAIYTAYCRLAGLASTTAGFAGFWDHPQKGHAA